MNKIPKEITNIISALESAGFEAYLVGGCVRDFLLHVEPKDWDITTNASPVEIQKLFPDSVYENVFGTVGVKTRKEEKGEDVKKKEVVEIVEITPYRLESKYSDKRHPDKVSFTGNIKDDLKRRDFTINAMAMSVKPEKTNTETKSHGLRQDKTQMIVSGFEVIDFFDGQKDLKNKVIRAVGNPRERFNEDALRILRAVRFSAQLGFEIEKETKKAIIEKSRNLEMVAKERIKDEFVKIIMSDRPKQGIVVAQELGILRYIIPELEEGIGVEQSRSHKYPVWEHNLSALEHAGSQGWSLEVRLSALLHDVGKPFSRRFDKIKKLYTFYGHEVVGAKMSIKVLSRLRFSKRTIDLVSKFVRYHMFFSDTEQITLSAVRRIVRNVGAEHVWDLMKVRFCDRVGMGRPKEEPYRLRKYESMLEEAMRAPLSVTMMKIDGADLMELLHVKPGPKIGNLLHALFEEVLDDPEKNTKEYLEKRALELNAFDEKELMKLGKKAKETKEKAEDVEIKGIRKKWWVR